MINPYTHRHTVREPDMFFGRTDVLNRLYALLANGQSVSVVGDRRLGKSSLLYCAKLPEVQERIPGYDFSNHLFVYVDLQGSRYREPSALLDHLLRQASRQSGGRFSKPKLPISPDVFEDAIFRLNQQGITVVFLLDEFDCIARNDRLNMAFFSFLRYMATNYGLSLVVVSHQRLGALCHADIVDSPFFNIFAVITLGVLKENAARDLILIPSQRAGRSLAPYADWALELAGTHPFFLQILCFYLIEGYRRGGPMDLGWVKDRFYQEAADHFAYAWEHADDATRQQMQRSHYLTAGSAFRDFVRSKATNAPSPGVRAADVEAALEHLWSTVWLAQSPLAALQPVQRHLAHTDLPHITPNQGKALHQVLLIAIEHLQQGRAADKTDKRWRGWYILHHKYVERESNRQIYMQLSLSERTFYRERNEAIRALATVLGSMN